MRAVALSDELVQEKIADSFVPLKVSIKPGTEELPLDWPALKNWRTAYELMGGEKCDGFTACTVVSTDLEAEYGNTGSAFVWEMFDSIAYDAVKFAAMLDRALQRAEGESEIVADESLSQDERDQELAGFRARTRAALANEGRFRLPPKGFTIDGAVELFRISGDLPAE